MRKRRIFQGILLGAVLLSLIGFIFASHPPDPVYQRKHLSAWLKDYGTDSQWGANGHTSETDEAVRQLGTNSIPFLLNLFEKRDSHITTLAIKLINREDPYTPISPAWVGYWRAGKAFSVLGPKGSPALPTLAAYIYSPDIYIPGSVNAVVGDVASWALGSIGSNSVPFLVKALGDPRSFVKTRAADGLIEIGPAAEPAIPLLVACLTNADSETRQTAAIALGKIGKQPELVVPALTKCLQASDQTLVQHASTALGRFGPQAKSTFPILLTLLADPKRNEYAKRYQVSAANKIAPELTLQAVPLMLNDVKRTDANIGIITGYIKDTPGGPEVSVPLLMNWIDETEGQVQLQVIGALGDFGKKAEIALPKLHSLKSNTNYGVAKVAAIAARRIESGGENDLLVSYRSTQKSILNSKTNPPTPQNAAPEPGHD